MPDRHERAVFLAAGEHYSQYFINGFRADGYCEEGAGYWAYGFGKYVLLREILADATAGRVDLFANPKIRKIAEYGIDIQMMDGLAPPFADCRFGTKVDAGLVAYCQRTLGLGNPGDDAKVAARSNRRSPSCSRPRRRVQRAARHADSREGSASASLVFRCDRRARLPACAGRRLAVSVRPSRRAAMAATVTMISGHSSSPSAARSWWAIPAGRTPTTTRPSARSVMSGKF